MNIFIMVVIITNTLSSHGGYSNKTNTITMQEFKSEATCLFAANKMVEKLKQSGSSVQTFCLIK